MEGTNNMQDSKEKVYLGISGELVAGKTTASNFFISHYDAEYLKFSKVLDMILDVLDLPHSRKNEQDLGVILKEDYGGDVLVNALIKMSERSPKHLIIFDGLRKEEELKKLKELPNSYFLYIKTSIEKRYERMTQRGEKTNEINQSFEDFKKSQEHAADEDLKKLESHADFVIDNNGTREEYIEKLREIGEKIC